MTEELKQKAEEYANHNDWFEFSANVDKIGNAIRTKMERAYIAGATENDIQWHDLRKVPNDLPKKVGNYLVCYLDTMLKRHSFELSYVDYLEDAHWIDEDNHNIERYDEVVIAWCEIPQFKE